MRLLMTLVLLPAVAAGAEAARPSPGATRCARASA